MAENLGNWPSGREPISKIGPSDGCGRDAVPLAVERWYDFLEFGVIWEMSVKVGILFCAMFHRKKVCFFSSCSMNSFFIADEVMN